MLNLTDTVDDRDGIGLIHVTRASDLADTSNDRRSSSWPPATRGYAYGSMNFSWEFSGNVWNRTFYLTTDSTGYLNLVLTWNATPTCSSPSVCSGHGPDADLNLYLYDYTTGALVATSTSFDNNYEAIVKALTPNRTYRVQVRKASTVAASTYFGLAWSTFTPGCPGP